MGSRARWGLRKYIMINQSKICQKTQWRGAYRRILLIEMILLWILKLIFLIVKYSLEMKRNAKPTPWWEKQERSPKNYFKEWISLNSKWSWISWRQDPRQHHTNPSKYSVWSPSNPSFLRALRTCITVFSTILSLKRTKSIPQCWGRTRNIIITGWDRIARNIIRAGCILKVWVLAKRAEAKWPKIVRGTSGNALKYRNWRVTARMGKCQALDPAVY